MKEYTIKPNKKLIKNLKKYWQQIEMIENEYWAQIALMEHQIEEETGMIGIELFHCDGSIVGIGNTDRTMKLIHRR